MHCLFLCENVLCTVSCKTLFIFHTCVGERGQTCFVIVEQSTSGLSKKFRGSSEASGAPLHSVLIVLYLMFSCSCVSFMALTENHVIASKANGGLQGLFIYLERQTKAPGFQL